MTVKKILVIAICCTLPVLIIGFLLSRGNQNGSSTNDQQIGEVFPILGRNHVPEGTKVTTYNSNPPTSGDHWPQPAEWGIYSSPLPDEQLVHSLEHGGIWISYKDKEFHTSTGSEKERAIKIKIEQIAKKYPQAVILTPRPENDAKIALASWGRLDTFDVLDIERIEKFIQSNINKSPEPLASLKQAPTGTLAVGASFPDFTVTEVDGRTITKDSLKGKPAIIWFTTSWCVPCQIGAKEVSRLDKELGRKGFEVLVVFVDPRETDSDLINWRKQFANPTWKLAFNNGLAEKIGIRYLDSKYILDKDGVIKDFNTSIADDQYLALIRSVVGVNK